MNGKNYYMTQGIDSSGIAAVHNPAQMSDYNPLKLTPRRVNIGDYFNTDSQYDETLGDVNSAIEEGLTVEDLRAEKQSGWAMAGNALANNLVIAGTTAIGGVLGLVDGILEAAAEQDISKLWDNPVNNWVVEMQDKAREAMPIYRGTEYENKSNLSKLGTGIFWADLIQNLGFTEGMIIPGMAVGGLLSSAPTAVRAIIPSIVSSMGEGSIEAINSRNDEVRNKIALATQSYNEMVSQIKEPALIDIIDNEYNKTLDAIQEDAVNAGNFVFGSNIALLSMSNSLQFGKLFSRGFGTAKRIKGALKRQGEGLASEYGVNSGLYMAQTAVKKTGDMFMEGMEELSQSAISATPSNYLDYNTFNESIFNPEKRELVSDLWKSFGQTYAQTLKDPQAQLEFLMGAFTGAIGVPMLKFGKVPIKLENNIIGEMYNTYTETKRLEGLADQINQRLQQDESIRSYYNGVVRHLSLQDRMNAALDNEDAYDYNTAQSAQMISDIQMFDEAGDIENYRAMLEQAIDTSDEGIQALIQETSKDGEGPFMQNGNPMSIEEVRQELEYRKQTILNKVDSYLMDKRGIEINYPNADSETIRNAVFIKGQIRDHQDRFKELIKDSYTGVKDLLEGIAELLPQEQSEQMNDVISGITAENFFINYTQNAKFKESIDEALDDDTFFPIDQRQQIKDKLQDMQKLKDSLVKYNKDLKDILTNPGKSVQERLKLEEKVTQKKDLQESLDTVDKINNSTVSDLVNLSDEGEIDFDELEASLEDLEDSEAMDKIDQAREVIDASDMAMEDLSSLLEDESITQEQFDDSVALLNNSRRVAESPEELLDLDTEVFDDTSVLDDVSLREELRRKAEDQELSEEDISQQYQDALQYRKDNAKNALQVVRALGRKRKEQVAQLPQGTPIAQDTSTEQTGHDSVDKNNPVNAPVLQQQSAQDINKQMTDNLLKALKLSRDQNPEIAKYLDNILSYIDRGIAAGMDANGIFDAISKTETFSRLESALSPSIRVTIQSIIQSKQNGQEAKPTAQTQTQINSVTVTPDITPSVVDDIIEDENKRKEDQATEAFIEQTSQEGTSIGVSAINGVYNYWRPSTTEFPIHRERGNDNPYWKTVNTPARERYQKVFEFLKDSGAFDRIKNNQVKKGDEIQFGISKKLTESIGKPVILLLDKDGNVLGDLPIPDDVNFKNYAGLSQLYDGASNWYKENHESLHTEGNDIAIIPGYKSNVARNMVGKPQYTAQNERHTLNQINTVTTSDGSQKQLPFRLGIAIANSNSSRVRIMSDAGRSKSQNASPLERTIIPPLKSTNGQPFLLMPTSSSTRAFVTVPITMPRFNINNSQVADSDLGKIIIQKIQELATISTDAEDLQRWTDDLRELLAIKEVYVGKDRVSLGIQGRHSNFVVKVKAPGDNQWVTLFSGKQEDAPTTVLQKLSENGGTTIQVSRKYINTTYANKDYNYMIGELAQTNLPIGATHTINDWFTIDPIINRKQQKAHSPKTTRTNPNPIQGKVTRFTDNIGNGYYMDNSYEVYRENPNGNDILLEGDQYNILKAQMYGLKAGNSMTKPYDTPWGYYNPQLRRFEIKPSQATEQSKLQESSQKPSRQEVSLRDLKVGDVYELSYAEYPNAKPEAFTVEEVKPDGKLVVHKNSDFSKRMVTPKNINDYGTPKIIRIGQKSSTTDKPVTTDKQVTRQDSIDALKKMGLLSRKERSAALDKASDENLAKLASMSKIKARKALERFDAKVKSSMDSTAIDNLLEQVMGSKSLNREVVDQMEADKSWSQDAEVKRMQKSLPQLSQEGRIRVVNGLIRIVESKDPAYAWGQFQDGIITLSGRAARGTMYHESFHFVTQTLLTQQELDSLYRDAKRRYGKSSRLELEEQLAEDFRRFMQSYEDDGFFKNIFKTLKHIIKNLLGKETITNKLFHDIRRGAIASRSVNTSSNTLYRGTSIQYDELQQLLESAKLDARRAVGDVFKRYNQFRKDPKTQKKWNGNLLQYTSTRYMTDSEAISNIPMQYKDFLDVVEDQGKYIIVYRQKSIDDVVDKARAYADLEVRNLERQIRDFDVEDSYQRELQQYYNERLNYSKLNQYQRDYITERGLPIEEYNSMTPQEKEVFFKCMY